MDLDAERRLACVNYVNVEDTGRSIVPAVFFFDTAEERPETHKQGTLFLCNVGFSRGSRTGIVWP